MGIDDAVSAFVRKHIRTVDDLHLLITLASTSDRWWDETSVAGELGIEKSAARTLLERFAGQNLLEIRATEGVRYQYRPGTPELREVTRRFLNVYRANSASIWRTVAQPGARRSVRDFAEAFRIRSDDDR